MSQICSARPRVARAARASIAVGLLVVVSGCGIITGTDCHTGIFPAISVDVSDAETGQPLVAVVTISGRFGEEVRQGASVLSEASSPGSYGVTVQRDGYEVWTRAGIEVGEDDCGAARTERVEAELIPSEGHP